MHPTGKGIGVNTLGVIPPNERGNHGPPLLIPQFWHSGKIAALRHVCAQASLMPQFLTAKFACAGTHECVLHQIYDALNERSPRLQKGSAASGSTAQGIDGGIPKRTSRPPARRLPGAGGPRAVQAGPSPRHRRGPSARPPPCCNRAPAR